MAGLGKSSVVQRGLTFATGLVECLCFAGALFGWASLVFVLKKEDYFSSECINTTTANGTDLDCSGQDEQFSLVFTIASFLCIFMTLPSGFFFDRFGTAVSRLIAIVLYTAGTLLVAFSTAVMSNLLFPALSFIAMGGILFLITNMPVGNLFGSRRSTIITLYNGAFDSSSALFFVIKLIYEAGISLLPPFLFLSACSVIHLLRTIFLMPRGHIPYPLPDDYTYGVTCGKSKTLTLHITANDNTEMATEEVEDIPVKQEKSLRECVLSRLFWLHVLWLSVMLLRHYLFIGTLNPMLQRLTEGEPSLVSRYINAFAITQLCGVLCAPWNGLIMDRNKGKPRAAGESEQEADLRSSVLSLFLTALQCVVFSVCATIPNLPLQYFTFVIQVINRSFLFGGNAAFISVAFPPCHFGKLYGLVMALSAVFSLLQYACFALVNGPLDGDPLYVNIALTLLILFAFIHPLSVYLHCRSLASKRAINASS
ncbi:equilibrative nucleobase transporter 1-like [Centropristis striata]|uniref:equilibrative nucleobase transporter 1-like n=1 Tax=Centropristis striata TaxID=184440 RepID=UPI0027E09FE1|nr:equilibrative nucleobase transporter 1-like [Centropristis striata]XP_059202239.1 equilibrative nucleobase transporter 1-like [Centropristis striata]